MKSRNPKLIAAILFSAMMAAFPAQAKTSDTATMAGLQSELASKLAETGTLQASLSTFSADNERLMKENKVLADNRTQQQKQLEAMIRAAQNALAGEQARRQAQIDAVIAEYDNLGCVGTLPQARYDYCVGARSQYQSRVDQMKTSGTTALTELRERELARARPIDDIIARQNARINEIANAMTSNFRQYTAAQDKLKVANERVAAIRLELTGRTAYDPNTLNKIRPRFDTRLGRDQKIVYANVSLTDGKAIAWLHSHGHVIDRTDDDEYARFKIGLEPADLERFTTQFPYKPGKTKARMQSQRPASNCPPSTTTTSRPAPCRWNRRTSSPSCTSRRPTPSSFYRRVRQSTR